MGTDRRRLAWAVVMLDEGSTSCPAQTSSPAAQRVLTTDYNYLIFMMDADRGANALIYNEGGPGPCGSARRIAASISTGAGSTGQVIGVGPDDNHHSIKVQIGEGGGDTSLRRTDLRVPVCVLEHGRASRLRGSGPDRSSVLLEQGQRNWRCRLPAASPAFRPVPVPSPWRSG